uniref:Uncharacterized protein n=1 Tax=viral metagenome TaxID=1070528 RepID=A0A6C0EF24_9ZZZZ
MSNIYQYYYFDYPFNFIKNKFFIIFKLIII